MDKAVGCYAYGNMFCQPYFKLYLSSSDDIPNRTDSQVFSCLLYTSDAADE